MKQISLSLLMIITMVSVTGATLVVPALASDFTGEEIKRYQKEQEKKLIEEARLQKFKATQLGQPVREVTITNVTLRKIEEDSILSKAGQKLQSVFRSSSWLFLIFTLGFLSFIAFGLRSMFRRSVFVA